MKHASALYRLLGDEARLRLLRVLSRQRLNVTELTGVLGLAQSGVSRHLGLLKDARPRRRRARRRLQLLPRWRRRCRTTAVTSLSPILRAQFDEAADDPAVRADEARLQEVLRLRKENFDRARRPRHARCTPARPRPQLGRVVARAGSADAAR